jgi:hypothetical protein
VKLPKGTQKITRFTWLDIEIGDTQDYPFKEGTKIVYVIEAQNSHNEKKYVRILLAIPI